MHIAKRSLGIGLLCLAGFFLFNPTVSVVDLLPDCIGYVILYFALRKLADINDHIETAIGYTKRMIVVSLAQFLSVFVLFGFVSEPEKPTTYLLFSFVFSVFEIVFLSRLYGEFFEGMIYLGSRKNGTAVFENRATERMSRITGFFFVAKACLATLPEFSALVHNTDSRWRFLYNHIGLFRTVALLIALPIGIHWLFRLCKYVRSVVADRSFIEQLETTYAQDVLPKKEIFMQRSVAVAFVMMSIGICFSLDLYLDDRSILPDFLCPLFVLAALLLLKKHFRISTLALCCCGAHFVSSLAVYICNYLFFSKYTLLLTRLSAEAYDAHLSLGIVKTLDSFLFFLMIYFLLPSLKDMVLEHTGFSPISESNVHQEDKIRYIHDALNKRLYVARILAIVCALSSPVVFFCTRVLYIARRASFLWMIELIVYLIFAVYLIKTLFAIKREVGYKYLLS